MLMPVFAESQLPLRRTHIFSTWHETAAASAFVKTPGMLPDCMQSEKTLWVLRSRHEILRSGLCRMVAIRGNDCPSVSSGGNATNYYLTQNARNIDISALRTDCAKCMHRAPLSAKAIRILIFQDGPGTPEKLSVGFAPFNAFLYGHKGFHYNVLKMPTLVRAPDSSVVKQAPSWP